MMAKAKSSLGKKESSPATKPRYFLSYSTGEPQVEFFAECLQLFFGCYFQLARTPSTLKPGESQHDAILNTIRGCAFGVVCLDGLRPNVVFEYGAMKAIGIPVLPFKEESAKVDIQHFFDAVVQVATPEVKLDKQFSNVKDMHYKSWKRTELEKTLKTIWEAYTASCSTMSQYVTIPEPKVW